jgi:hypothetical protein
MKRISLLVAVVGVLSGCGGGSVSGNVSGISLAVQDSIFFVIKDDAGKTQYLSVFMGDKPNLCETLKANRLPKSATSLSFNLLNVKVENGVQTFLAPDVGSFTVIDTMITQTGTYATANFSKLDSNCTQSLADTATGGKSGLVKITTLNAAANGSLAGTFDVSIGTQTDHLTGTLNARFCDVTKIPANLSCE